jgi:predicted nucleic acid-binding protein
MQDDKTFVDTNILVYAYDNTAGQKHDIAKRIVWDLWASGLGVLSTQVLQEFFVSVTAKIPRPMDTRTAKGIVSDLLTWDVVVIDGQSILNGVDIQVKYRYSFWDSLIIEAAWKARSPLLFTEDLSDGQVIRSVTIRNPFKAISRQEARGERL